MSYRRSRTSGQSENRDQYRPTAASIISRNFRFKNPTCSLTQFVNFADPGFGIHLTFPDMEGAAVEFGMGLSLTLIDGVISAGYGWNLTSDSRRGYYFVGLDAFGLLQKARERL